MDEKIVFGLILLLITAVLEASGRSVKRSSGIETNKEIVIDLLQFNFHRNDAESEMHNDCSLPTVCSKENYGKNHHTVMTLIEILSNKTSLFNKNLIVSTTYRSNDFNWTEFGYSINMMKPDAISVANYGIDDGPEILKTVLQNTTISILSSHLNEDKVSSTGTIKKSTVFNVDGHKIGIIGYVPHDKKKNGNHDDIPFSNEITVIQEEVKKLESQGVNILIALSQGGYACNQEIAREVEGIDLVLIGGHTNTSLDQTRNEVNSEVSKADYPTVVIQKNGRKAYIARAFDDNNQVGNVSIHFDGDGEIKYISGKSRKLAVVLDDLEKELEIFIKNEIPKCKIGECKLGNFIADVIAYNNSEETDNTLKIKPPIAFVKTETFLKIIENPEEIMSEFNRRNAFFKVKISGKILREILEFNAQNLTGGSLQLSGIKVTYDFSKPFGSRVVEVYAHCFVCENSDLEELKDDNIYTVMIDELLMNYSKDLYNIIKNSETNTPYEILYHSPRLVWAIIRKNGWEIPSLGRLTILNQ